MPSGGVKIKAWWMAVMSIGACGAEGLEAIDKPTISTHLRCHLQNN